MKKKQSTKKSRKTDCMSSGRSGRNSCAGKPGAEGEQGKEGTVCGSGINVGDLPQYAFDPAG